MKKFAAFLSILMVLALMVGFMPTGSVFAKAPGTSVLVVHNNTNGNVIFNLGGTEQFTLLPGISFITIDAAMHNYYASLPCNIQKSGTINLNVNKELYFFCQHTKGFEMYNYSRRYVAPVYCPILGPIRQDFPFGFCPPA